MLDLIDVTERLGDASIASLLALAVGDPTPNRLASLANSYLTTPNLVAYGLFDGSSIQALAGLEILSTSAAAVRQIAVTPLSQGSGLGRKIMTDLIALLNLSNLEAETDEQAIGFYSSLGFSVQSLGEKYPGVERFRCQWNAA